MTELLASIMIAVCPIPDSVDLTECHEQILNCAVELGGKINETTIEKCLDERGVGRD